MANEIRTSGTMIIKYGGLSTTVQASLAADLAGMQAATPQTITTASWQALEIPSSLTAIARLFLKNESASNYVELAFDNAGSSKLAKLVAGDWVYIPLPASTTAIYAKANTASVAVTFVAS